jgi:hypothetical protein
MDREFAPGGTTCLFRLPAGPSQIVDRRRRNVMVMRRRTWVFTILVALLISGAVPAAKLSARLVRTNNSVLSGPAHAEQSAIAAVDGAALGRQLAGTWIVNVDQPGFPPSQRHFTFNADGGLVTNDDLQVGPLFVEHFTVAQGNWIRTGTRNAAATIVGQRYNLQGGFVGTFKVRMNLEVDFLTNQWSATFRIEIALPNGHVFFTSDGTFQATRLEVEPL